MKVDVFDTIYDIQHIFERIFDNYERSTFCIFFFNKLLRIFEYINRNFFFNCVIYRVFFRQLSIS